MSNRVYTYPKITELKKASYFTEIAPIPQLTMSREMATNMAFDMKIFKGNILGFSSFQQRLFPGWSTSGQKFAYVTMLNQFMREKIASAKDKAERDWLFGCKKNLYAAISNIIRLEEANVRPEDIVDTDRDMLLFIEMWKLLEHGNDSIKEFRIQREKLKRTEYFDEEVNKIFKFHGSKKIVWNGFQFLTPMQRFVFECFRDAKYEIYALIQDEERYPYANEIWNHLYDAKNGFPGRSEWIRQDDTLPRNPLGEIFETGEKNNSSNIRIIKYSNTIEFIEDVPRIKDAGYYLYCPDDHSANSMLKDYFPERYEERNLLAYPIGQFIYALHQMWDENLQCIVLNQNGLRKCFASGWLSVNGKSSIKYTEDLERLLPYFDGCYTVDQWNARLENFIDSYENAIDVFAVNNASNPQEKRKKEVLGNPFKFFGVYSIKEDRIDDVIDIIAQLMKMAKKLFGANEPISIHEHMSKLDALLYMNDGMPKELNQDERSKVKKIFEALENEKIRDFLCYPGDLAAALLSFMGDKIEDDDKNNKGLKTLVFNIFQVEAAPLAAKGKVHICLADISKLPGASAKYSWPIDEDMLRHIIQKKQDTYVPNWIENNGLTALSNRYYVYTALKNNEVEISWIQKQGEKLYSPSPYITLIDKLTESKIHSSDVRTLDMQHVSEVMAHKRMEKDYDIRDNEEIHQYDSELEYCSCPMRYVYSYVLGDNPTYRNEYQQNRAIVRFIQSLKELLGSKYSLEQIAEQVFELFPNIRKAEKRQMIDDATRWSLPDNDLPYTTDGDFNYTNRRLNMMFLDERSYESAKKHASMLMSQDGRKGIFHDRNGLEGARNCEFCPHSSYCMKSLFGVDYKGDQE